MNETEVMVNGRRYSWNPRTGLAPEAVKELEGFLRSLAHRTLQGHPWLNLDINDLLQEMRLAALKAARTYDPAKGANFLTWASYAAKGALSGGTRSLVSGTQNGRQAMVVNYQQIFQEEAGEDAWLDTQVWLEPDAHHRAEDAERKARLKGLMARLDPKDREILRLRLGLGVGGGGLDARAVARRLGLKPAQVLASMGRIMALAQGAAEDLQLAS